MNKVLTVVKFILTALVELERKFWYVIVLLLMVNGCIFYFECSSGKMEVKSVGKDIFTVQSISYDKTTKSSTVVVVETKSLVKDRLSTYSFVLPFTPKQLAKMKVNKSKPIKIENTIMYNDVGKIYRVLEKVYVTNKVGQLSAIDIKNL